MNEFELLRQEVRDRHGLPAPAVRRALRRAAGVTLATLASSVGVSREAVRLWELGAVEPLRENASRYRQALQILRDERPASPARAEGKASREPG